MTDTKTTGAGPDETNNEATELLTACRNILPYIKYTIGPETASYHPTMPSAAAAFECAYNQALKAQDQQDTAMAMVLAKIRQIIGVDENTALDQLPDLVRAAVKREWLPIDDYAKSGIKIIGADMIGPSKHHEIGCLSWDAHEQCWRDYGFQYITCTPEPTHYMPLPAPPQTGGEDQ